MSRYISVLSQRFNPILRVFLRAFVWSHNVRFKYFIYVKIKFNLYHILDCIWTVCIDYYIILSKVDGSVFQSLKMCNKFEYLYAVKFILSLIVRLISILYNNYKQLIALVNNFYNIINTILTLLVVRILSLWFGQQKFEKWIKKLFGYLRLYLPFCHAHLLGRWNIGNTIIFP